MPFWHVSGVIECRFIIICYKLQFAEIEDTVRRKLNNLPLSGASLKSQLILQSMRGIELHPDRVDFGVLKEGNTYSFTSALKNTGLDACRFRVRQPPPSTGIKVTYKPGPVSCKFVI